MEEILYEILAELKEMNAKMDALDTSIKDFKEDIKGIGMYNTIGDLGEKLDDACIQLGNVQYVTEQIQGKGSGNSMKDVCSKIDDVHDKLSEVVFAINLK